MPILINGELSQSVPAQDRALHYGDGVFETIAWRSGRAELWVRHMARLQQSCKRLNLPVIGEKIWHDDIIRLQPANQAVIKLLLSRGVSGRGYQYGKAGTPTRMVAVYDWPNWPGDRARQGVVVRLCNTPVSVNAALAGIKHLNRLDNVLARNEWEDDAVAEGLMCDDRGCIIEGTMTNVFGVKNNALFTPRLHRAGVRGVMRDHVMDIASSHGMRVDECRIRPDELLDMDEVFLTNSLIGIWPVVQLDDTRWPIGPVTRHLQDECRVSV